MKFVIIHLIYDALLARSCPSASDETSAEYNAIYMHGVLYYKYDKLNLFKDTKITEARHGIPAQALLIISKNKITLNAWLFTASPLEDTKLKMNTIFNEMYAAGLL